MEFESKENELDEKIGSLKERISRFGSVVVAFSGGIDSGLLAYISHLALGSSASLAVTAVSASLADEEVSACRDLAMEWGVSFQETSTYEFADPDYVANSSLRCFFCKTALMDALSPIAGSRGATVLLGVNVDDVADYRPGQRAASERGARFPLLDEGLGKVEIREMARHLGLSIWDKPSSACLSSRIPYGTPVTIASLNSVAMAESALRTLGLKQVRVRHHGDVARIEVPIESFPQLLEVRDKVVAACKTAGYIYVSFDLEGFRSGSMNSVLAPRSQREDLEVSNGKI